MAIINVQGDDCNYENFEIDLTDLADFQLDLAKFVPSDHLEHTFEFKIPPGVEVEQKWGKVILSMDITIDKEPSSRPEGDDSGIKVSESGSPLLIKNFLNSDDNIASIHDFKRLSLHEI